MPSTYNIFISHSWAYGDAYDRLIELLNKKPYFIFRDYSVPKDDPIHNAPNSQALADAITRQMRPCHVVLLMAGVYASYSIWIQREIRIGKNAFESPKPIVAIKPRGNTQVSQVVSSNADRLVGWNTDSIVEAIRDLA